MSDRPAPATAVAGPDDWPEVTALRTRVFVEEQGVPAEIEQDAADATAVHALSRDAAGQVVATGRLLLRDDGTASIGRMATDATSRGRGHGAAVLARLQDEARRRGAGTVELHAQVTARGFYERAGYAAVGAEFVEAGIPHVTMVRRLEAGPLQGPAASVRVVGGAGSSVDRSGCEETRPVRPSE